MFLKIIVVIYLILVTTVAVSYTICFFDEKSFKWQSFKNRFIQNKNDILFWIFTIGTFPAFILSLILMIFGWIVIKIMNIMHFLD